jgi:cardiolipin synthase
MTSYITAESLKLVFSGTDYFDTLCTIITNCRKVLHVQTYIFDTDATGMRVVNALKEAASRGVKIYLLPDAFGSNSFSKKAIKELKEAGIHFRFFAPLFSSESIFFGRRLHHKIVVADESVALVGGINIADKYSFNDDNIRPWLDYAVYIRGDVCKCLHLLCESFYNRTGFKELAKWERDHKYTTAKDSPFMIRFRRNDWFRKKNEIHKSYMEALREAKHSITIAASYFLPGKNFRRMLERASAKGVEIKIILAGKSDVSSVRLAESYLYQFYIRNKIKIYEWHNSVMHGKVMVVDDKWCTIGSYNLNYLSHYISIELNADILSPPFIHEIDHHFKTIAGKDCVLVNLERFNTKFGLWKKFTIWLAYAFHKLIMNTVKSGKKRR